MHTVFTHFTTFFYAFFTQSSICKKLKGVTSQCALCTLLFVCRQLGFYLVTHYCTIRERYLWKRVLKELATIAAIQFDFTQCKC